MRFPNRVASLLAVASLLVGGCAPQQGGSPAAQPTGASQTPLDPTDSPMPATSPTPTVPTAPPTESTSPMPPRQQLPTGFSYVTDLAPTIRVELRYATAHNFTGAVVPGYESTTAAILRTPAAKALAKAQATLADQGLTLLIYDAYRPTQAVAAFVKWSQNSDQSTKAEFYPKVAKKDLFRQGYIATRSQHSLGSTVDLTIVGTNGEPLDMGGPFDLFDPRSHYRASGLTAEQTRNRTLLRQTMQANGFAAYDTEWWHFTHSGSVTGTGQNFPVR